MEPGLHVVAEPGHVYSWLIAGSERSVLLDTGLGIADIEAAIASVSAAPVTVVNSHVHFDHVGGNELFDQVACTSSARCGSSRAREEYLNGYRELPPGCTAAGGAPARARSPGLVPDRSRRDARVAGRPARRAGLAHRPAAADRAAGRWRRRRARGPHDAGHPHAGPRARPHLPGRRGRGDPVRAGSGLLRTAADPREGPTSRPTRDRCGAWPTS